MSYYHSVDKHELKIKFESLLHEVDVDTYIDNLQAFSKIIQEVNSELKDEGAIEIKINANREGSFIVDLVLSTYPAVGTAVGVLFNKEIYSYGTEVIKTVTGLYNLHKTLNGKKPLSTETIDGSVKIENVTGNLTYHDNRVFHIYQNNKIIRQSISRGFQSLNDDAEVLGFELLDKNNKPLVEISREKFAALSSADTLNIQKENVEAKTVHLSIVTLSFDPKKKWEFVYEGNIISAKMTNDFYGNIEKGEKFAKGDQLETELEIRQELDEAVGAYVNKSYKIAKILKHIPRAEQGNLFR